MENSGDAGKEVDTWGEETGISRRSGIWNHGPLDVAKYGKNSCHQARNWVLEF